MKSKGNFRERSSLNRHRINSRVFRSAFRGLRSHLAFPCMCEMMPCHTSIPNVKSRKKINNGGHNFQTMRKRKWNIIKLYKQRGKSIKFNAAHLSAYF